MIQNKNSTVNALASAERELIASATYCVEGAKSDAMRPSNMKSGAPGGCPTWSLNAVAMNSPQSQRLTVGSSVNR